VSWKKHERGGGDRTRAVVLVELGVVMQRVAVLALFWAL